MYKAIIFMIVVLCSGCGDCNKVGNDIPYSGDATAIDPYVEVEELFWLPGSCDTMGCTYFFTTTAWLHNPRDMEFNTEVLCEMWDDNYLIGDYTFENITVGGDRSKELTYKEQYTVAEPSNITVTCGIQ